jgi:soluble lytic murein transglycosylase
MTLSMKTSCLVNSIAIVAFGILAMNSASFAESANREPLSVQTETRVSHAKELLGRGYKKSAVRISESTKDITQFVKETTKKFLPKKYRKSSGAIAKAIVESSELYHMDPVFVMAVIQNESSFNPTRRGSFGEIGLMQIKPSTAEWIADSYDLDYKDEKTLLNPVHNIEIGVALLDKLRHQFESKSRLYLSAYNIGAKKVRTMVEDKRIPKEYVIAVMKRYIAMYSAFKIEGNWKERGEIAFHNTRDAIQKKAKPVQVTSNQS